LRLTVTAFKLFSVFALFSANAVQYAPGHWTLCGLYSWIMDWSGYLFNVYKRYKVFINLTAYF